MSNDLTAQAARYLGKKIDAAYLEREKRWQAEQAQIARENSGTRKATDGLGAPVLSVPTEVAAEWRQKHGRDCLRDPDFLKYKKRTNPECFIKASGTKTQVGYGN